MEKRQTPIPEVQRRDSAHYESYNPRRIGDSLPLWMAGRSERAKSRPLRFADAKRLLPYFGKGERAYYMTKRWITEHCRVPSNEHEALSKLAARRAGV